MTIFFETLNIIRPIVDKISTIEGVEAIYLFGSRAKGNAQIKSDIDLAINCPTVNSHGWHDISKIVENAQTLIKIDCIRFDELNQNSTLRAEIEKDKIVLFQKRVRNSYDLNLIFESTEKALSAFEFVIKQPMDPELTNIDSTIQRFEFTIELFWKLLRKILLIKGVQAQYPKDVLKEAYAGSLIQDEQVWLDMLKDRNQTSHTYDQPLALEIYGRMPTYLEVFQKTLNSLKPLLNDK